MFQREPSLKSIFTKIFCIFLLQGFAYNAFAHVYLDYPQGGETFQANTIITIEWHIAIPHEQLNWDLFFSADGGNTWQPIQLDLPVSQLTYSWVVPSISTSQARISIIQDNVDMDYQDESMDFTIVPEPMTPFIDIVAQNLNLECDINSQQTTIQNWLDNHGGATAVGFCGDLVWTHDYAGLTNECGATGNAFVTFTAADSCGSASTSAFLTVFDISPPVIQMPANDLTVECGGNTTVLYNNWIGNIGGAFAADECGDVIWTVQAIEPSNGCGTTGSTSVIFIAIDECGNSSTTSADFSVEDSLAPNFQVPAQDNTITCDTPDQQTILQNWLNNHGGALAFDDCGNVVTWTNDYSTLSDGCGTTGSTMVTFIATDQCNNSAATTASFSIIDNVAPDINITAKDTTINCGDSNAQALIQNWLLNHGGASAGDNCSTVSWTNDFPPMADSCTIPGSIPVRFIASDECSNSDTTTAIITLSTTTGTFVPPVDELIFKISPNPASGILKITFDNVESFPVRIFLFDSRGNQVLSDHANATEKYIPVAGYAPGIYFIQAETFREIHTRRVVIIK